MQKKKHSFIGNVLFYLCYPLILLISILPFRLLYVISDIISAILFTLIRYRRKVIISNIQTAFPDYNKNRVLEIARESTRHLSDMMFEMIKSISLSKSEMNKRFKITNMDYINGLSRFHKPVFGVTGHYANFDWSMVIGDHINMTVNSVYKPIKNKPIDQLIRKTRSKFNAQLTPVKEARSLVTELVKKAKEAVVFMIIDQSPKLMRPQYFALFFNKPTAVFRGFEELAIECNAVTVYFQITKVKRGYYQATGIEMCINARETDPWELTNKFFGLLENQIKKQPEYYLWSHKRWKVNLSNAPQILGLSPQVQQLIDRQEHLPFSES